MNTKFRQDVLDHIKNNTQGVSFQSIANATQSSENLSENDRKNFTDTVHEVLADLEKAGEVKRVKNPKGHSNKLTFYKFIKPKVHKTPILTSADNETSDTNNKGCAGEYAVMSELLFLNFDVNLMSVDRGKDIIAHKDGEYYFVQVKTTNLNKDGQATWYIPKATLNSFFSDNRMRYVLVARCLAYGKQQNRYFCFTNSEISTFKTQGFITSSKEKITVKVKYEDHIPFLLGKNSKQDLSLWENFDSMVGRTIDNDD